MSRLGPRMFFVHGARVWERGCMRDALALTLLVMFCTRSAWILRAEQRAVERCVAVALAGVLLVAVQHV